MRYMIWLEYDGGSKSHQGKYMNRKDVCEHLNRITSDAELLNMASRIHISLNGDDVLNAPTCKGQKYILSAVKWPKLGSKKKIECPVTTTVYLPEKVYSHLKKIGDGSISKGIRQLVVDAGRQELTDSWIS